ncbi:MAG: nicotinate-nicotinamide nucleotide adenylyltransferase [Phycisphaerales bacterium]|nr:nicotinate-nicotinamide nucleotide adenylyltransferase [Phycisphaerales bacterium]
MTITRATSAPVPESARSVLLFGGSFDPPHNAHFQLPELVRSHLALDHILYIPAARSPHKKDAPSAPPQLRVAMLRAGLEANPRAAVWTAELDRARDNPGAPSFTIDTIRELRRQRPHLALRLLIGADQALSFHKWREPGEIIRLAPPAVMLRGDNHAGHPAAHLINDLASIWGNDQARRWAARIVPVPMLDLNATQIRSALSHWAPGTPPPDACIRGLPPAVLDLLSANNPYRAVM